MTDEEYYEFIQPYEDAKQMLLTRLDVLNHNLYGDASARPIHNIQCRIKKKQSIEEKLQRKGKEPTVMNAKDYLQDIAGVRVICYFVDDIYNLTELLKSQSDLIVIKERDYIGNPKPNGYRSYHVIINYPINSIAGYKEIICEIQIRTLAMNFWATIEHSLQYKYKTNIPPYVKERLANAAQAIIALDGEMSSVRNEIMNAQNSSLMQRNLVMDILQNIENLYQKSNRREVEKIQDEFYRIYETKDLEQLRRFHSDLDNITEGYHVQAIK